MAALDSDVHVPLLHTFPTLERDRGSSADTVAGEASARIVSVVSAKHVLTTRQPLQSMQ